MKRSRFEKRNNKILGGKGFYIALVVCLVAIGVSAWTTYNNVVEFISPGGEQTSSAEPKQETQLSEIEENTGAFFSGVAQETQSPEPIVATEASPQKADPNDAASEPAREPDSLIVYPVGKEVVKGFSDANPVYSKTFQDWRVHNGTDFASQIGNTVRAMTSGTVKDIYDDPALGMTVVIEHDSGLTAYYSGLGDTTLVQKDQAVSAGDEIGSINDVPCEIGDGAHLHLGIKKDGQWVDPMDILEQDNEQD